MSMPNIQTEAKPQCWRAVAVFDDRPEILVYLNRSSPQVRAGLRTAFFEVLDDEEQAACKSIALQRWHGAPTRALGAPEHAGDPDRREAGAVGMRRSRQAWLPFDPGARGVRTHGRRGSFFCKSHGTNGLRLAPALPIRGRPTLV